MASALDELMTRMEDPQATFTTDEVQTLIDWYVQKACTDEYQTAKVATAMQQAAAVSDYARSAMDQLLNLWDPRPMVPTLQVVSDGQ